MCQICIDFEKDRLTVHEAFQNLAEMEESIPEQHYDEVLEMLNKAFEVESNSNYSEDYDILSSIDSVNHKTMQNDDMWDSFWNDDESGWRDLGFDEED